MLVVDLSIQLGDLNARQVKRKTRGRRRTAHRRRPPGAPRWTSRGFSGARAGAELAVVVQPPATRPGRPMVVDIFLPAAFEAAAIIVAGLFEAADPLAGLVADQLAGFGRFRAVRKARHRRGESDGESRHDREDS